MKKILAVAAYPFKLIRSFFDFIIAILIPVSKVELFVMEEELFVGSYTRIKVRSMTETSILMISNSEFLMAEKQG